MKKRKLGKSGPSVFRFRARLFRHPNMAKTGCWTLLNVPKMVSKKLPSRGIAKVEGTMNGHPFRAALEPNTSGSHWLRVNKAMREGAGADAGDMVKLVILGPAPEPTFPADFRVALTASQEAKTLWKAGSNRPRTLRPGPAGSHGASNSFPQESGALVV